MDGPYTIQALKQFAFGILKWTPDVFYQCLAEDLGHAITGYSREFFFADEVSRNNLRTLAVSISSAIAHDWDNIIDVWKTEPIAQTSPIDDKNKLEALSNHFKPAI